MKRLCTFLCLLIPFSGLCQSTATTVKAAVSTNLPDNTTKVISPALLRSSLNAMIDYTDTKKSSQWQDLASNTIQFTGNINVGMMKLNPYPATTISTGSTGTAGMLSYQSDGNKGLYVHDGTGFKRASTQWTDEGVGNISYAGAATLTGSFAARTRMRIYGSSPELLIENSGATLLSALKFSNSGMFGMANDAMQINTAGGNVGIGTVPLTDAKLTVLGNMKVGSSGNIIVGSGTGTGTTNTIMGATTGLANTTGHSSVVMGYEAYQNNTTGNNNVAIGRNAMVGNVVGYTNVAVGASALNNNNANANTGVGYQAMYDNSTGVNNTAIGSFAGLGMTTGSHNVVIGTSVTSVNSFAKLGITTGSYNTIIGANVSGLAPATSNNIVLADGQGNRRINVDATGNVGIGTNTPTAKLQVVGSIGFGVGGATDLSTALNNKANLANPSFTGNMTLQSFAGLPASFIAVDGTGKVIRAPIPQNVTDVGINTDGENTIAVYSSNGTSEVTLLSALNSKSIWSIRALSNSPYTAVYIPELKGFYYHDTTDNTSVDDGKYVIVTPDAKRYKTLPSKEKYTKQFNKPLNYAVDSIVVLQAEHQVISPEMVTMRSENGVMMLPYKINSTTKRVVVYFNKDKAYKGSFTIF
jgi:hypothetical protein